MSADSSLWVHSMRDQYAAHQAGNKTPADAVFVGTSRQKPGQPQERAYSLFVLVFMCQLVQ